MGPTRRDFLGAGGTAVFAAVTARKGFSAPVSEHTVQVLPEQEIGKIRPELHGQFAEHLGSCVYGGLWVGPNSKIPNIRGHRKAAVEYLRALGVPVLRWPGGCFADDYHWRDGIGPAAKRPKTVNLHWGEYTEDNSFGTHEFIDLCRLIGAEPYFAGNVGTGSPTEMRNWMEYCNFPAGSSLSDERARNGSAEPFHVKYWGVGNELWGCGGGLTGGDYATMYRNFSTFLPKIGDTQPFLIACGPSKDNAEWTQQFFSGLNKTRRMPDGYTMHYYSNGKDAATAFGTTNMNLQFASFSLMEAAILHQRSLIDPFDTQKQVGLMVDEWGVWDRMVPEEEKTHGRLWQQITARAGVATAMGLNVFHRQADKLVMCNIAQIVNVLDSMLLTDGDKCIRTPAYYAFDLMKVHKGQMAVKTDAPSDDALGLSVSASWQGNLASVTFVNPKQEAGMKVRCGVAGKKIGSAKARSLHHSDLNACNTFDAPDTLVPKDLAVTMRGTEMVLELAPLSVTTVEVHLALMQTPAISVQALVKRYTKAKANAVDGVSFDVPRGQIFGLLGPNGAGKTTTIGVLTTGIVPTEGTATIMGVDVARNPIDLKRRIAVVPQQSNLDRSLRVREILTFHAAYHGVARKEREALADELLNELGLGERKNDKVNRYSGGMAQRLMIARALMHAPDVLFLDEPTNNLDPQSRLFLWERIRALHANGLTILLTTHDMEEADQLCQRIAVMDHGKILVNDTPAQLKTMIPGGTALEVRAHAEGAESAAIRERVGAALRALARVTKVDETEEFVYRLYAESANTLIGPAAQAVLAAGAEVRDLSVKRPSLEEVFIFLTGRHLR